MFYQRQILRFLTVELSKLKYTTKLKYGMFFMIMCNRIIPLKCLIFVNILKKVIFGSLHNIDLISLRKIFRDGRKSNYIKEMCSIAVFSLKQCYRAV